MLTLLLASLTVAAVTSTWISGSLFIPAHKWLATWRGHRYIGLIARGAQCHFCVSHWIAAGLALGWWFAPDVTQIVMLAWSAVFLGNLAMIGWSYVTNRVQRTPARAA